MNDMLNGIPEFVEAVEAGGFSAAAARMNLSRSAIGKAIARLERRLNTRLFHRTTRMQSLTDEGQAFYERCRRALDEIQSGEAMLESGKREVTGRLRISMPVLFGRRCAAPLLLELARMHPKLELDLSFSDRVVDLFEEGFDLAIRNGVLRDEAGLAARKVALHRMTLCASPDYLAARGAPQAIDDLAGHDLIVYARSGERRNGPSCRRTARPSIIFPKRVCASMIWRSLPTRRRPGWGSRGCLAGWCVTTWLPARSRRR